MLSELLPAEIYGVLFVFVRVGAALMFMPAFSEPFVLPRARLILALFISLIIYPVLSDVIPALPSNPFALLLLVIGEAVVGLFLGTMARIMMGAMSTAGMILSTMTALANALTNDPTAAQQGSIAGSLLSTLALLIIVILNLHHLLLIALIDSYALFVPGQGLPMGDFSDMFARIVGKSFALGFQIASPFVGLGLIFFLSLGLMTRLMPQIQIFFVAMPLQILLGITVLFFALPVAIRWFIASFENTMAPFVGG